MNNLTTRKIVLGLLLAFVLALGVQGITDAVETDLGTESTSTVDITARQIGSGIPDRAIDPTLEDSADSQGPDNTNTNETITVSTSNIQLTAPSFTRSTVTFSESTAADKQTATSRRLTDDSFTLQGYIIGEGKATLTIRYTELSERQGGDTGDTSSKSITHTYTYYAVKSDANIPNTATLRLTRNSTSVNSAGYINGLNGREDYRIFSNNTGNYPVKYSVAATGGGSGTPTLYFNDDPYMASNPDSTTSISSSSGRKVWLDMNGSGSTSTFGEGRTSVVTVDIGENSDNPKSRYKVAYIFGAPKLDINLTPTGADSAVTGGTSSLTSTTDSGITAKANDARGRYGFTGGTAGSSVGTITATVGDGRSTVGAADGNLTGGAIEGVLVKFELRHKGSTTGNLSIASGGGRRVDAKNNEKGLGSSPPSIAETLYVQTNSGGQAVANYQFGTLGSQEITVSSVGLSKKVTAAIGTGQTDERISIDTNRQQSGSPKKYDLVALVEDGDRNPISSKRVTFSTDRGTLTEVSSLARDGENNPILNTNEAVAVTTNAFGKAHVVYDLGDNTGRQEIRASFSDGSDRESVIFVVNGPAAPGGGGGGEVPAQTNRLTISTTGEGTTRSVTVNALTTTNASIPGLSVLLSGTALTTPQTVTTGTATTITLPSTPGDYTLIATDPNGTFALATINVTVSAPGTLAIDAVGARSGTQQQLTVTATGGTIPSGGLLVRLTGVTNPTTVIIPSGSRSVSRIATLPSATSAHTVSASATGFSDAPSITIPAPGQQPTPGQQPGPAGGTAESIEIDGSRQLSGTLAQAIRLRVRVLDANDRGVSDVGVVFRVLAPGQGTFAGARGSGRAIRRDTDRTGYANANFTPTNEGDLIVEAKAAGVTAPVTFIIGVGEATTTDTSTPATGTSDTAGPRTYKVGEKVGISLEDTLTFRGVQTLNGTAYTCVGSGECVVSYGTLVKGEIQAAPIPKEVQSKTYKVGEKVGISLEDTLTFKGVRTLNGTTYTCVGSGECVVSYGTLVKGEIQVSTVTTPSTSDSARPSAPEVLIDAANRPVMYWIDGGALYQLAGANATQIAASATDVAVDTASGKLYYIEQTSETTGAVHTANLDGTNAAVLKALTSVPKGLALDPANAKLYLTNGWGKIQRMNVDGTQFETNFLVGLGSPMSIAVSADRVYWTDGSGRVRHASLQTPAMIRDIVTGAGALGGLAVDARKVYWTETTGERSGKIRSSNLAGTGAVADVYTVTAPVHGLAIDPAANNQLYWTNGWGKVQRGVSNARYAQDVVTGLMTSPPPTVLTIGGANTATTPTTPTPTKTTTAAKPNYDVDGSGTVDNADLFLVSLAVGTNNAKYDVNGDGTVDDKDIALVRDNRDKGAAAAPMIVGVKLTAEQVGRLQAQIDVLVATNDRSPATLKTLVYLQQLIAMARPEKTQLLANYPNPFNPETWIPYELATDTDVRITIYNAQGVVIRTLQLGQQSAGYYTDRERAAYWDGRNALGEQVASGIYFYQLETDTLSALRKMVILK